MNKARPVLTAFFSLPAITAIASIGWLVSIPADARNSIIFGLSASRLAVTGILLLVALAFVAAAILTWRRDQASRGWIDRQVERFGPLLLGTSAVIFFAALYAVNLPEKYLGQFQAVHARLLPLLVWICATSFQAGIGTIGWLASKRGEKIRETAPVQKILLASGMALVILLSIITVIAITKLGIAPVETFWTKPAAPILWPQMLLAFVLGIAVTALLPDKKWATLIFLSVIVIGAAILWNTQDFVPGAFNSPAHPPSFDIFPINDSFIFDAASQKLLTGQGMPSDVIDKPLYIAQLAMLHGLGGASYANFYILQILFFTSIPVCGYFLGRELHSRQLGTIFAILLVIKETNAIALTNYLAVSTTKMILSEPLTTLGVLLFTLVFTRWLKGTLTASPALWVGGGILGLTGLVRLNSATILPAAILLIGLAVKFQWKKWFVFSTLLAAFAFLSFTPWMTRTYIKSGDPINFIRAKTEGVIVEQRYNPSIEQVPEETPQHDNQEPSQFDAYIQLGRKILHHYIHNLIGVSFVLPPSTESTRLLDVFRLPFWKIGWDGTFSPAQFLMLLLVMVGTAIGLGTVWARLGAAGLAPLAVALGYNLSTAIALTSGGRYLQPFEWCILLYFGIGLMELLIWIGILLKNKAHAPEIDNVPSPAYRFRWKDLTFTVSAILALGFFPVAIEAAPASRYQPSPDIHAFWQANSALPELAQSGFAQKLDSFAADPNTIIAQGRLLYPRYYAAGEGETSEQNAPLLSKQGYNRLTFVLITPTVYLAQPKSGDVILPLASIPDPAIQGADTWLIGCQRENYVDALFVIVEKPDGTKELFQNQLRQDCQ